MSVLYEETSWLPLNSYFEKWGATGRLRQGYGLTETNSVCTTNSNEDFRRGSVGKALRGVTVELWDDNHKPVPNGEVGEFAISGPTIMEGYHADGEADDYGIYTDENGKSITVRIFFSHDERTLTREEVQSVVDGVIANLEKQGIMLKK